MRHVAVCCILFVITACVSGRSFTWDSARALKVGMTEAEAKEVMGKPQVRVQNATYPAATNLSWYHINHLTGARNQFTVVTYQGKVVQTPPLPPSGPLPPNWSPPPTLIDQPQHPSPEWKRTRPRGKISDTIDAFSQVRSVSSPSIEFSLGQGRSFLTVVCAPSEGKAHCSLHLHSVAKDWVHLKHSPRAFEVIADATRFELPVLSKDSEVVAAEVLSESYAAGISFSRLTALVDSDDVRVRLRPSVYVVDEGAQEILRSFIRHIREHP